MLQAPRIVRWTLPALLLTLVVGGAIIVATSGFGGAPAQAAHRSGEPATTTAARKRGPTKRMSVRRGDTPTAIAERAKITLSELLALNPGLDPRTLRPGRRLKISP